MSLYAREQERVDMFEGTRFTLSGIYQWEAELACISCDMGAVLEGAFLVMVTTPSQYHTIVAKEMAPHLVSGQTVVLNPGRTFGTFEFSKALRAAGCQADVTLAEMETFVFTCRCDTVAAPIIYSVKRDVKVAAHQVQRTPGVTQLLGGLFPSICAASSVLETGLSNLGMIFHPVPVLMNLTRIEAKERFLYYKEGITPLVAGVLERLDAERLSVADALGVSVSPAIAWLGARYGAQGNNLYETIQDTDAYANVYAPTDTRTRYVFEDVATGCVPIVCIGQALGLTTPITKAVVDWASAVYGVDFYKRGRNAEKLPIGEIVAAAKTAGGK